MAVLAYAAFSMLQALAAQNYNGRVGVGFSDATGAAFELRVALPGVGEALKREIAGLVWVDR